MKYSSGAVAKKTRCSSDAVLALSVALHSLALNQPMMEMRDAQSPTGVGCLKVVLRARNASPTNPSWVTMACSDSQLAASWLCLSVAAIKSLTQRPCNAAVEAKDRTAFLIRIRIRMKSGIGSPPYY